MTPKEVYRRRCPASSCSGPWSNRPSTRTSGRTAALATAWALTDDGVLVTNWHVFDQMGKECYGVVNHKGEVFPVIDALGADPTADIAVIRVAGKGFTPLPLAADERWGRGSPCSAIRATSSSRSPKGTSPATRRTASTTSRQRWMSLSADFAYGSSGAPVLNRFGAVVGMATVTANIDYPADELSGEKSAGDKEGPSPKSPEKLPEKPLHKTSDSVASKAAREGRRAAVVRGGRGFAGADGREDGRAGPDDSRVLHGGTFAGAGEREVATPLSPGGRGVGGEGACAAERILVDFTPLVPPYDST